MPRWVVVCRGCSRRRRQWLRPRRLRVYSARRGGSVARCARENRGVRFRACVSPLPLSLSLRSCSPATMVSLSALYTHDHCRGCRRDRLTKHNSPGFTWVFFIPSCIHRHTHAYICLFCFLVEGGYTTPLVSTNSDSAPLLGSLVRRFEAKVFAIFDHFVSRAFGNPSRFLASAKSKLAGMPVERRARSLWYSDEESKGLCQADLRRNTRLGRGTSELSGTSVAKVRPSPASRHELSEISSPGRGFSPS